MDAPGRQHWNKGLRPKGVATFWKRKDIRQDLRENHRAGDHEANNWIFCQDLKNEHQDIVEGLVPSETKEETTNNRLRAINLGELTILRTSVLTDW
jgi:hypothetical protein